jgi:hypothetical protein
MAGHRYFGEQRKHTGMWREYYYQAVAEIIKIVCQKRTELARTVRHPRWRRTALLQALTTQVIQSRQVSFDRAHSLSYVTRSRESGFLPAMTELGPHLADHVFVFAVRLLESRCLVIESGA